MMLNPVVRLQSNRHNAYYRRVRTRFCYPARRFLRSSEGDLLISGGDATERCALLMRFLKTEQARQSRPSIILTESEELETRLISMAESGSLGRRLYVCSRRYPNFDLFSGMTSGQIAGFFADAARAQGYHDAGHLVNYCTAFLSVLDRRAPLSLESIIAFLQNNDAAIAQEAIRQGMTAEADVLLSSPQGGSDMRGLVLLLDSAFPFFVRGRESGLSLTTAAMENALILVRAEAPQLPEIMSAYFAHELRGMREHSLLCALDCPSLLRFDPMRLTLDLLKQSPAVTVAVSTNNAQAALGENAIQDFDRCVLLFRAPGSAMDSQRLLSSLGEYTHSEALSTVSTPPRLVFSARRSESVGPVMFNRQRVLFQEVDRYDAVLLGHSGAEILCVQNLFL